MSDPLKDRDSLERILQQKLAHLHEKVMSAGHRSAYQLIDVQGIEQAGQEEAAKSDLEEDCIPEGPMTSIHKQILTRNRTILVDNMIPTDLFRHLVARNTLTSAEERRIRGHNKTWEDINSELLDQTSRRSDSAFTHLQQALRETCQDHLADLLQESQGKQGHVEEVMSPENKQAIHQHRAQLASDVTPDEIFNDLISEKVLSASEVSRIKEKSTREEMNECLLDYIVRRCNRAFGAFIHSLRNTGQEHLAKLLSTGNPRLEQKRKKLKSLNISVSNPSIENSPAPSTATVVIQTSKCNPSTVQRSESTLHNNTRHPFPSTPASQQPSMFVNHFPSSTVKSFDCSSAFTVTTSHIPTVSQSKTDPIQTVSSQQALFPQGSCAVDDVKQQIMYMAENAYANVRRKDDTSESFRQFSKEMSQTTESINDSLNVFSMIKEFCEETDDGSGGPGQREESSSFHDNQTLTEI